MISLCYQQIHLSSCYGFYYYLLLLLNNLSLAFCFSMSVCVIPRNLIIFYHYFYLHTSIIWRFIVALPPTLPQRNIATRKWHLINKFIIYDNIEQVLEGQKRNNNYFFCLWEGRRFFFVYGFPY